MKKVYVIVGLALLLTGSLLISSPLLAGNQANQRENTIRVLVGFDGNSNAQAIQQINSVGGTVTATFKHISVVGAIIPVNEQATLKQSLAITFVEPQATFYVDSTSFQAGLDSHLESEEEIPYGINNVNAPAVWEMGYTGQGVRIAVLDSGLDYDHPDAPLNINKDLSYDFVAEDSIPEDVFGHGTHVTGTIAAPQNGIGVVGVAPGAEIVAYKVCGDTFDDGCSFEDLLQATERAIEDDVDIITMSLGGPVNVDPSVGFNPLALQDGMRQHIQWKFLLDYAYSNGILITAASGNDGSPASTHYPSGYDSVISVGAVDMNNVLASFSNWGGHQELVAPGVDVLSTVPRGSGYETILNELSPTTRGFQANPMTYTGIGDVTGELYWAGLGTTADFDASAAGKIALIQRGGFSFLTKATNAINAGATGVIIFNNGEGNFFGTLQSPISGAENIPVVSISNADGLALLAEVEAGSVSVNLAIIASDYDFNSGTSMATPHVAGVAALLMSANSGLSNAAVRSLLAATALNLGPEGVRDAYYGYGLVDALAGVLAALP